ncbi:type 2 lantipeptide synthetase LanM [Thiorhodococcus mannitoliphagus]|uniref:Type 2 lantipeptide synthetase LanM n=1 Tax=Thiorhodococcus mannitoliphagus TaxID=329406 RepID=A0A6P1DS28_9GAMM|nr:type 2 lanthipeptide synthetase LanM family protein [Thiorhodococcus mannitoliphagus]NEX19731.1 type 2 lantipeptide synthetase LanM [Thiorhodococcus mannitoliphagus]
MLQEHALIKGIESGWQAGISRLTDTDLDALYRRALTLPERLTSLDRTAPTELASPETLDAICQAWRSALAARPASDLLEARLAWAGWRYEDLARALCDGAVPARRPEWLQAVCGLVDWTATWYAVPEPAGTAFDGRIPGAPLAFEELLAPAVDFAYRQLLGRLEGPDERLSRHLAEGSAHDLCRGLLAALTQLAEEVLFAELEARRPAGQSLVLRVRGGPALSEERGLYDRWVAELGGDGLHAVFQRYPVLARLLGTRLAQWITATAELVTRLERDWDALTEMAGQSATAQIAWIQGNLSDPHHEGRSVMVLGFADGARMLYKPRDLRLDTAFASFLDWLDAAGGGRLRAPRVLERDGYGWVEYLEPAPIQEPDGVGRFYRNAGRLMCVVHLLGGTDCHEDNLMACGEDLVLLDPETLFHRDVDLGDADVAGLADAGALGLETVLKTGFLPTWTSSLDGRGALDVSGLGSAVSVRADAPAARVSGWGAINSDLMHRVVREVRPEPGTNLPQLAGATQGIDPADYLDELLVGFREAYLACERGRDALLAAADSPLLAFRGCRSRYVFRATAVYYGLQRQLLKPANLVSGLSWGWVIEKLARAAFLVPDDQATRAMVLTEMAQMVRLDIPHFSLAVHGEPPPGPSGTAQPLLRSELASTHQFLERLGAADLRLQRELIRAAYIAQRQPVDMVFSAPAAAVALGQSEPDPLAPSVCSGEAARIAAVLEQRAMRLWGQPQWLGFRLSPAVDRWQLDLVSLGLYEGKAGIALFLAALEAVTGETRYRRLWVDALRPLRDAVDDPGVAPRLAREGLGLGAGLGGILYASAVLADLVPAEAEWLLPAAETLAGQISAEMIANDVALDLIGGSAGAILGLLALHARTGRAELLERARACAAHLERQLPARLASRAAPPAGLLTGLSHGAAGIALALGRLAACVDEPGLWTLVEALRAAEDAHFDAAATNWSDLRHGDGHFMTSWCHGAPGIALGRLGLMQLGRDADGALRQDWQAGLDCIGHTGDLGIDHLCCGNLGLTEVLLESSRVCDDAELRRAALARTAGVLQQRSDETGYRLFSVLGGQALNPGFFQGIAGIGYQLLRLVQPERLPSVLLFAAPSRSAAPARRARDSMRSGAPSGVAAPFDRRPGSGASKGLGVMARARVDTGSTAPTAVERISGSCGFLNHSQGGKNHVFK